MESSLNMSHKLKPTREEILHKISLTCESHQWNVILP